MIEMSTIDDYDYYNTISSCYAHIILCIVVLTSQEN